MSLPQTTAHLQLPFLMPSQAQKHVTHNEALQLLDALVQLAVLDSTRTEPPEDPVEGQRHLVASGASSDWEGQSGAIAVYLGGAWSYLSPKAGWRVVDLGTGAELFHDGSGWTLPAARELQGARLSLGTGADGLNRLAVASPASLLLRTDWQGRAEIGLAGNDDLSVKVSADGASFTEALRIDRATGFLTGAAIATGPEDHREGRVLRAGAAGLGRPDAPAISDWEDGSAHVNGFCTSDDTVTGEAPPADGALCGGLVLSHEISGLRRSLVLQHVGGSGLALRGYKESEATGPWAEVYSQANLLGPVSQSAGQPTGAVFETGSNPAGAFTRHADGRLECRHVVTSSSSAATSWTYPASFIAPPVVSLTPVATGLASAQLDAAPTASGLSLSLRDGTGARLAAPCHMIAIGRWYRDEPEGRGQPLKGACSWQIRKGIERGGPKGSPFHCR